MSRTLNWVSRWISALSVPRAEARRHHRVVRLASGTRIERSSSMDFEAAAGRKHLGSERSSRPGVGLREGAIAEGRGFAPVSGLDRVHGASDGVLPHWLNVDLLISALRDGLRIGEHTETLSSMLVFLYNNLEKFTGQRRISLVCDVVLDQTIFSRLFAFWNSEVRILYHNLLVHRTFYWNRRFLPLSTDRAILRESGAFDEEAILAMCAHGTRVGTATDAAGRAYVHDDHGGGTKDAGDHSAEMKQGRGRRADRGPPRGLETETDLHISGKFDALMTFAREQLRRVEVASAGILASNEVIDAVRGEERRKIMFSSRVCCYAKASLKNYTELLVDYYKKARSLPARERVPVPQLRVGRFAIH
jgi:hypothetical protein